MTQSTLDVPDHQSTLAREVAAFCREGYTPPAAGLRDTFPSNATWAAFAAAGSEPWLDTGDIDAIQKLWTREFRALTTNNTLLNKEVQKGLYDELVPRAAQLLRSADPAISEQQLVLEIAFILNAVHGLKLVRTFDADVSVELHTDLARDAEASYRYGKRFAAIEPERFIVKVPLTPEGIVAARRLHDDGIRLNFTLGFSARQNYAIAKLARPDWVNVFMGRLNSFVADNQLGDGVNVGEKATLASQRAMRETDSKQIGASIRSGQQVFDLAGIDVHTIPTAAAEDFLASHGDPAAIADHTADDPTVTLADGVEVDPIAAFWTVDDPFRSAVDGLAGQDPSTWSGDHIRQGLAGTGIFPDLSSEDLGQLRDAGKIPVFAQWQARVAADQAAWDGMLTLAALESFAKDQAALDDRIRRFL